ncbi:MAG: YlxR family protein [Labilithrix sp.]|nr:YlxR family protein [Labilithrix sp.]
MTTNDESARTARKGPSGTSSRSERTCAGCGKHAAADELVRVVHDPSSGEVAVDLASSGFGRGAHFHPSPDCVAKALKGGLARVFKSKVVGDASAIGEAIVKAADRRIEGLLTGARRAGQLAVGADVVAEALREERAKLVVVARDAAAATRLPEIERAIASGQAVALGDKQRLGSLMSGRGEVAVIAVLHPGVAAAVSQTYRMSGPFRSAASVVAPPGGAGTESQDVRSEEAWSSSEVR